MIHDRDVPAEQQGDGQPENQRELEDPSGGAAMRGRPAATDRSAAGASNAGGGGGTSDAGTAADDAAASSAYRRGPPGDLTRQTGDSSLEQDL